MYTHISHLNRLCTFNWYFWSCGVWRRQNRYVRAVGPSFNYQQMRSLWKPPRAFICHISQGKAEVVPVNTMKPNWQVDKHIHSFLVLPLHSICFIPPVRTEQDAVWAPAHVWTRRREKSLGPARNWASIPQLLWITNRCSYMQSILFHC